MIKYNVGQKVYWDVTRENQSGIPFTTTESGKVVSCESAITSIFDQFCNTVRFIDTDKLRTTRNA